MTCSARTKLRDEAAQGVYAAWLLVVAESIVALYLRREAVTSIWEVQWGLLGLAPIVISLAGVFGALGGTLVWLVRHPGSAQRFALCLVVGVFAGVSGWGVGGGRHLAQSDVRSLFAGAVGVLACVVAFAAAPILRGWIQRRPSAVALAATVSILNLEFANQRLFVRLYPAFHISLCIVCCLLAPLAVISVGTSTTGRNTSFRRWTIAVPLVVMIVAASMAQMGARLLSNFDNFRWLLVESAPLLGQGIRLGARIVPPPPIRPSCLVDNASVDCADRHQTQGRSFSLTGRDLLLVTIDALRADHVGAYGYSRSTTPNIDKLANQGVRFDHAYAATAHTSYSVTSLMTGKYMRPLLLQGAGLDSETWATFLQHYGARTAAFYPPAVFFIDPARFETFQRNHLGFEYRKVEFLEGAARAQQVLEYVSTQKPDQPLFIWVHLFAPHEPYEKHDGFDFGDRDIDRYDSEVAYSDNAVGQIVANVRQTRPNCLVIVSSDHGEEFGDHGGRYHGTSVYEEQVRVPLIVNAPDLFAPRVVREPVQTIDLLPTILAGLDIPRPPRIRGRDLGGLLVGKTAEGAGLALSETEEQLLLADSNYRLVCSRQLGACKLFNLETDPTEQRDVAIEHATELATLRRRERELSASHGQFEAEGLRAEGRGWPSAILRGVAGDGDAADEVASLLDDADPSIRRKAAEVLFELRRPSTRDPLLLALARDEDASVKAWAALALTRLGHGAPLVVDMLASSDRQWRRLAALALAEAGDRRGAALLVDWWRDEKSRSYQRSRELLAALGRIRWRDAVVPLCNGLTDVRLRPWIAEALAEIGDEAARGPLVRAFAQERYQSARISLAEALARLKAKDELAQPLVRFMGVPDPLPGALGIALRSGILESVGGPDHRTLRHLQQRANIGTTVGLYIPRGGNDKGIRILARVSNTSLTLGELRVGVGGVAAAVSRSDGHKKMDEFSGERFVSLEVPPACHGAELSITAPKTMGLRAGAAVELRVLATTTVNVEALAAVPLTDEIPAPAPEPWRPGDG
ncbi:MAG TPA: sulfatase-like hydrolase/transferase, partial [Polyangiaceae bacterium]